MVLTESIKCIKSRNPLKVKVKTRHELSAIPEIANRMAEIEKTLEGTGRLLVRYSGTEPKVRIMIEGENNQLINALADSLAGIIREKLG